MKFLITGATGFIGEKLLTALIKKYNDPNNVFYILTRRNKIQTNEFFSRNNIVVCTGDITDKEEMEKYFVGIDFVFHLASKFDYGDHETKNYYKINVEGSKNVFELSLKYGIKKVININTAGIYHPTFYLHANEQTQHPLEHTTRYTHSKYLSYLESIKFIKSGCPIINVLPVSVFGKGSPMFSPLDRMIKKMNVLAIPRLETKLSFIYIDDLVEGIILTFEKGELGGSYLFSGPEYSLKEFILLMAKHQNRQIRIIELPLPFVRLAFYLLGIVGRLLKKVFYFNSELLAFLEGGMIADGRKAQKELGFINSDFDICVKRMVEGEI